MPLASLDDINTHLPQDKLEVKEADVELYLVDAERIIKGYLSGTYSPVTLAGWGDPTETDPTQSGYVPQTIRAIAGRLIAARYYATRYAEDDTDISPFAQSIYDEGIALLNGVMSGSIELDDVVEIVTTGGHLTSEDFWPNDTTSGPMFTRDQTFA